MPYQELIVVLPCQGLEDFPLHLEGTEAEGLLAGWSALWHPALLASAGTTPDWRRATDPPHEFNQRLLIVPEISRALLPEGYLDRASAEGATVIVGQTDREQIVATALAGTGESAAIDVDLAADCLALGYCYLQVELLTRHMRYASNLDETLFRQRVLELASAAVAGHQEQAREGLADCFDMLSQQRDHYYPVDIYLIDLVLLAPTVVGEDLQCELASGVPLSVLASGATIEKMAASEPDSLAALRAALEGEVSLVGGEMREGRLPLMCSDAILHRLREGLAVYEKQLGRRPGVFGRRRFGLTPLLPNLIERSGFEGALHATLDDGRFPRGNQAKTRWEGLDGWAVETLARVPLDASRPETYLSFAKRLSEAMDLDHIAMVTLAHWPSRATPWHEDLRRINKYSSVLGKFVTLHELFTNTEYAGQLDRFRPDAYRSPYLRQDVEAGRPDPLSASVTYWRQRAAAQAAHTMHVLAELLRDEPASLAEDDQGSEQDTFAGLLGQVEASFDAADEAVPATASALVAKQNKLDQQLAAAGERAAAELARQLCGPAASAEEGMLLINPCSFARRVGIELPGQVQAPPVAGPVLASATIEKTGYAVVDLPSLGFAWIAPGGESPAGGRPSVRRLAEKTDEGYLLRNEYFEAHIHPETGGLKSLYDYQSRGNRLSQQLGLREAAPGDGNAASDEGVEYGRMEAESIEISLTGELTGRIESRGRLLGADGAIVARFQQVFTVFRGSRILGLQIELSPLRQLEPDPWNHYFACRFAWAEESAQLFRNVGYARQPTESRRVEAPLYVQIDSASTITTLLTGGLAYHRRSGPRMLDTLLAVRGETTQRYRLGLGVDTPYPLSAALEWLMPPVIVRRAGGPPAVGPQGWLMHLDAKNVVATHWEPLDGRAGFRVRLQETMGRAGRVRLGTFRPLGEARLVDCLGRQQYDCPIEEGRALIDLPAHGWIEVEACWFEADSSQSPADASATE